LKVPKSEEVDDYVTAAFSVMSFVQNEVYTALTKGAALQLHSTSSWARKELMSRAASIFMAILDGRPLSVNADGAAPAHANTMASPCPFECPLGANFSREPPFPSA